MGRVNGRGLRNAVTGEIMITVHDDCFVFSSKSKTLKIPYVEIIYIEQVENQLWISRNDQKEVPIAIQGRMRDIADNLESRFYLCHSYLIVNLSRVIFMSQGTITFDNGCTKHLGRDTYVRARKAFLNRSRGGI